MASGWTHRVMGVVGILWIVTLTILIANQPIVQVITVSLPVLSRLPMDTASGPALTFEVVTTAMVFLLAFVPLYRPRPRRILDVISLTQRRTILAMTVLAAIGYFDYTYRLPRLIVLIATPILLITLPIWFVAISRRPDQSSERAIIIGDDTEQMEAILETANLPVIGYVSPPSANDSNSRSGTSIARYTDGGTASLDNIANLGGLSRLDEVLIEYDIDTAVLAFEHPDRQEFFGALDCCFDHGVNAKVHREHADSVLTSGLGEGDLVDVNLEPWDWEDHVFKRLFDLAFAFVGLIFLTPVIALIAVAIKAEDGGSILYAQERTAALGDTFSVYKFRSMVEDAESDAQAVLSDEDRGAKDPRVTRVGRLIRRTHLDEIPQLWSILVGDMSVVGPRPERPELDYDIEVGVKEWRSRWFVKPGLTGLAQVNEVTGHNPSKKLRYDVEYIRRQSFWFDLKIVIRQIWIILEDFYKLLSADER